MTYDLDSFVCADFAEMLHNNAEAAGIRAAYVCIMLLNETEGHTLNAFETTDKGLVFIDCTAPIGGISDADTIVNLVEGSKYLPESIFPELTEGFFWISIGVVTEIEIIRW